MKLFQFLKRFQATPKPGKLRCEDCRAAIHKHDRYRIVIARHIDCGDPKLVGQKSMQGKL